MDDASFNTTFQFNTQNMFRFKTLANKSNRLIKQVSRSPHFQATDPKHYILKDLQSYKIQFEIFEELIRFDIKYPRNTNNLDRVAQSNGYYQGLIKEFEQYAAYLNDWLN